MMTQTKRPYGVPFAREGFSLIELAMTLAIVALIVAGVMLFFEDAGEKNRLASGIQEVTAIVSAVHTLEAGDASQSDISNTTVAKSGLLPDKWLGGISGIVTPWNTAVYIEKTTSAVGRAADFAVEFQGLGLRQCQELSSYDWGTAVDDYSINLYSFTSVPTPAQINAWCTNDATNEVHWGFN